MQRLNTYSNYIKQKYGERVQKISVDAGFTCPNRDGSKGIGGCTFCNNKSFSPGDRNFDLEKQFAKGVVHYQRRFPKLNKFIIYFQSYTNTYSDLNSLKSIYEKAIQFPGVVGISIGTRPDCLDKEKFEYFEELAKNIEVTLEIGVETCNDQTLIEINRGHDFQCFVDCIELGKNRGIKLATHLILGLPNESNEMMMDSIKKVSRLPLDFIKFHQLHLIKQTQLGNQFEKEPFPLMSKEEYFKILAEGVKHLNPNIKIQRLFGDAPKVLLINIPWSGNNSTWTQEFNNYLEQNQVHQGQNF